MIQAISSIAAARELLDQRRICDALSAFDEAEQLGADCCECSSGRWTCWMLLGQFERAWQESDKITAQGKFDPSRFWDGLPFPGKRVMIRCLHGLGDAIQFVRYAPLLRREAAAVTIQVPPKLVGLMRGVESADAVITWEDPEPPWDQQIEVMELPRAFATVAEEIPADVPYIRIDPAVMERSRRALRSSDSPKVGIFWAGSAWDASRSIPLAALDPIFELSGMTFYSLQCGGPETANLPPGIYDTSLHSCGIVDTGADILNMDLVITVDTMVAHLAGALGKPVWTLLPYRSDWRWMLERSDSPWYPTMRLFRQPSPGDWDPVIASVAGKLKRTFPAAR